MKTFKVYTLGCKVNKYDSDRLSAYLEDYGLMSAKEDADLVVINTCSVTKATGTKNSRMIALSRVENPRAKIVVCGCWARIYPEDNRNFASEFIVRDKDPELIIEKIAKEYNLQKTHLHNHSSLLKQERARYTIKVQDGCRQFCAYCVIPYSRGVLWSRDLCEILKEAQLAIDGGYKEIVLTGIHLGLYGRNGEGQTIGSENLVSLLKALLALGGDTHYRLSSIEITEVDDDLIDLFNKEQRLCKHLHISLQSGSDKILKLMNRPYSSSEYLEVLNKIRDKMPEFAITTDIIVGFPGETDEDSRTTESFASQARFSKIHVFPFSAHPKTPAYSMPNQVAVGEIKDRAERLRKLSDDLEDTYIKGFKGKNLEHLIIGKRKDKYICKTDYFFDTYVDSQELEKVYGKNIIGKRIVLNI